MDNETQTNDDGFTIDPEFQNLLPPLNSEDFENLEKDILEYGGCRDLLVVWEEEKILIDGHHRYKICKKHDLVYAYEEMSFENRDAVIEWMFENQKNRRNMNKFLWAEAVLKRKSSIEAEARANKSAGGGAVRLKSDKPVNTLKKLAKLAGVGRDTMHKVNVILTSATANPTNAKLAEQIKILRKGGAGVSINSVHEELQELVGKKRAKKTSRTKPKHRSKKVASNPLPKVSNEPPQDLAGHIIATLEELEQQYPELHDRIDLYNTISDLVSDWAHTKKSS